MKTINDFIDEDKVLNESMEYYDNIIKLLTEARENNQPIDEGILKAIVGGLAGITMGPAVMKGVAKVLGITENGALYNLMTSRMIVTALAAYLGYKN